MASYAGHRFPDLRRLRELAKQYLALEEQQLELAVISGKFTEICHEHHKA